MPAKAANFLAVVKDPDLIAWLEADSGEIRELIVEACLPERTVTLVKRPDGRMMPSGVQSVSAEQRTAILAELQTLLTPLLDVPPVVLKAAGAIAVRATSRQVRQFASQPLVKAIRANRQLAKAV